MRSPRGGLPRVRVAPRAPDSDGDLAGYLSTGYGLKPDDWQQDVLDDWLGRRRDGRWSAATCGIAVPRQNGKNGVIEMRELYGMAQLGERFLHTAHEVKTARKAFLRIASFFENPRQYPELAALVSDIRKTNGQEAVLLNNGGGVEFIARSRGSGRGFTVDVLVCDEAQELTDEELAALLPTISAAPLGNPQVILTGTPPDPAKVSQGEVFRRVRADGAERRDPRLAWVDFGVEDGILPDVDARDLWERCNPAVSAGRLSLLEVERERGLMSPETFARERLGWWGDPAGAASRVIPNWPGCRIEPCQPPQVAAVAIAVGMDAEWTCLVAAGKWDDGRVHVAISDDENGATDHARSTTWVTDRVKQIQDRHGCEVVMDSKCPDAHLAKRLRDAGVTVQELDLEQMLDAFASFRTAAEEKRVTHFGQPRLDGAFAAAVTRTVGDRSLLGRRQSGQDITPAEAATIARWAADQDADVWELWT